MMDVGVEQGVRSRVESSTSTMRRVQSEEVVVDHVGQHASEIATRRRPVARDAIRYVFALASRFREASAGSV